ncbi:hypothetical protein CTAYLR_004169 [Chrysophaeum taylorii]|uniref:Anoctamin transmembrane domain-containing protein n=1 Tax=Chrysophaeum taylorii TaxID=2483200 RepID=A0AAD7UL66_9STRA|nr:hypothetical protein CTAYLR_004169 [Chrysophaeum taylorii]
MGSQASRELSEPLMMSSYKFPNDRAKLRHTRDYDQSTTEEQRVDDAFDYLIVFFTKPDTGVGGLEARGDRKDAGESKSSPPDRISWNEVERIWFQTIPGEEDAKNRGVEWLRRAWRERFRTDVVSDAEGGDRIPMVAFQGLVREHVVEVLSGRAGLQLKIVGSSDGEKLYCLIRSPIRLLERKADQANYKLKFRKEVDPGREFWLKFSQHDYEKDQPEYVEIEEEQREYEKSAANEILEELYLAGKISENDMSVFDEFEPTKKHWSRRVHTLERVADKVPCTNRYPAYTDYSTDPQHRHLFDEYATARGKSLFLPKDRLFLTKRLIDEHFDFGVLVEQKIVCAITALHDANRGEDVNVKWLLHHWVFWWRAEPRVAGAPCVTYSSVDDDSPCPVHLRPWSQPLMEIRGYFGEKIALYFAWLGFYGFSLLVPAVAGIACAVYDLVFQVGDEAPGVHPEQIFLAVLVVSWTAYYKETWDIESQWCAIKWGTSDYSEVEADRPQFTGDPDKPLRLSPITNQMETHYPENKRSAAKLGSFCAVIGCVSVLVALVVFVFALEYALALAGFKIIANVGAVIVLAVLIPLASSAYVDVAKSLNDVENYRTQTDYENNLIRKKFMFEMFNTYAALFITAFFKGRFFECASGRDNCLQDTKVLLFAIFTIRFFFAVAAAFNLHGTTPPNPNDDATSAKKTINPLRSAAADDDDDDFVVDDRDDDLTSSLELGWSASARKNNDMHALDQTPRFEDELVLETYEGTFDDYAEIVLQMGLVSMFSLGLYLVPFFAASEVLLQLRIDAYKLCALTRRPDPVPAESVGNWAVLMDTMGLLAVFVNSGIIVFTTRSFDQYAFAQRILLWFVIEHVLMCAKIVTHISTVESEELNQVRKRQKVVVDRHKNVSDYGQVDDRDDYDGLTSTTTTTTGAVPLKRGNVDRDSLSAARVRAGTTNISAEAQHRKTWLEGKQREVEGEIKIARQNYRNASRTEIFRDDLGVSFSRKQPDLALGLATVTVLEAENVGTRHLPVEPKNCRLVVHVRDTAPQKDRRYEGPVGPSPQISKPARKPAVAPGTSASDKYAISRGSRLVFNQTFTLAPIKSAKAEIFFEIVDNVKRQRRATTALPLTDLVDQQSHSKTLLLAHSGASRSDEAAVLYVKARFQFSRIAPLKQRIFTLLDEQRKLKRDIMNIQLDKPLQHDWDFPDHGLGDAPPRRSSNLPAFNRPDDTSTVDESTKQEDDDDDDTATKTEND